MASREHHQLELAIEDALRPGDFINYKSGWSFVSGLEEVAARIADLHGDEGAPDLYETFIAGCYEKAEEIDDSSGNLGMFVDDLFSGWIKARQAIGSDPDETADLLVSWMENDDYGFCYHLEREAVKVLDSAGLAAFERTARGRWESAPTKRSPSATYPHRRWAEVLRAIYLAQRNVRAYVDICDRTELAPADCEAIAKVLRSLDEPAEALVWVERGIELGAQRRWNRSAWGLGAMRKELLAAIGRGEEALQAAWSEYCAAPSTFTYKALMTYVPSEARAEWHSRAMQAAEDGSLSSVIGLWLGTGELGRLVERLREMTDADLERLSHSVTEPAAKAIGPDHPEVAARIFRALGMRILASKKSRYYGAALSHFGRARDCYLRAELPGTWQVVVDQVRRDHGRKYSFMPGFEDIVEGRDKEPEPSFLERARTRWPRGGKR